MNTIKSNHVAQERDLSDAELAGVAGGNVVRILAKVFGWSPQQVDKILGRGDIPYTGGGGGDSALGDDGRE